MKTESSARALWTLNVSLLHFITAIPLMCGEEAGATSGRARWSKRFVSSASMSRWSLRACQTPVYTVTRILFNETLRWRQFAGEATIGIDADGYAIAGRRQFAFRISRVSKESWATQCVSREAPRGRAWRFRRGLRQNMPGAPTW